MKTKPNNNGNKTSCAKCGQEAWVWAVESELELWLCPLGSCDCHKLAIRSALPSPHLYNGHGKSAWFVGSCVDWEKERV